MILCYIPDYLIDFQQLIVLIVMILLSFASCVAFEGGVGITKSCHSHAFLVIDNSLIVLSYLDLGFRLSSIGYEPPLFFLMCNNSSSIYRNIFFILVIIFVFFLFLVSSLVITIVHSSMPVTTRSQTRRGLQQHVSSVPPLLLNSTCSNAVTSSLETIPESSTSETLHNLPELVHQSVLSSSSSEADTSLVSSLESEFENLEFRSFEFASGMVDTNNTIFKLPQ